MGLLEHQALAIIKGIGIVPGDTSSAEQDPVVLNLLDTAAGFSLVEWTPNIPSLKGGGLWADSPITDGRTLVSGVNTNVTETMVVQLTGATLQAYAAQFAKLQRMVQDARDFWDTFNQIEPVYLKWWASGAPGPQYARIYNIDMDVAWQDDPVQAQAKITLTIEREGGWLGVKPGGTPQEWAYYIDGASAEFNATNADLRQGTHHIASGTVHNRLEFGTLYTFSKNNFIDIPASKLPGDLPPLICLVCNFGGSSVHNTFVSRVSKPLTQSDREGHTLPRFNVLPASGGSLGTDASFVADATYGIAYTPVSATERRVSISFATASDQTRLTWLASSTFAHLNPNLLRGRYRVLLRCYQLGGALGNIAVYAVFQTGGGTFYTTPTINPVVSAAIPLLHDLGTISIPPYADSFSLSSGKGLSIADVYGGVGEQDGNIQIILHASRSVAAGTLQLFDLILMPFDEGAIDVVPSVGASSSNALMIYDETGYFSHGKPGVFATGRMVDGSWGDDEDVLVEPRGQLTLAPGVTNRLYFLRTEATTLESDTHETTDVKINIVPRWSGIRDA